jgi:chromosome segregation ATPase
VEGEHNRSVLQDFAGQLAGKEKDLQVRLRQFELLRGEIEEENKELRERIFKGMGLSPAEQTQLSEEIRTANYNNFEKQLMIDDMQRLNLFLEDLRKGLHLEMEQLRENRLDINREEQRTEINSSLLHIKTHVEKLESLIEEVEAQNRSLLAEVAVLKYETDDQEETSHRLFESLHLCRISNDKKMHRIEEAALNKL